MAVAAPVIISNPVIASLAASPATVAQSSTFVVLTAGGVGEANGVITQVRFYLELNGTPGLQTNPSTGDFLDFTATQGSNGKWTDTVDPSVDFDPQSGVYTFYAVAVDSKGRLSTPISVQVTYTGGTTAAPTIGKFTSSAATVVHGSTLTLTASNLVDSTNFPAAVSFYRESNGIPGLQVGAGGDILVGVDPTGNDPASIKITAPTAAGTYIYYAQLLDDTGVSSANGTGAIKLTITVT